MTENELHEDLVQFFFRQDAKLKVSIRMVKIMIEEGYMVPHPPIIVHEIGKGEEHQAEKTIQAYRKAAERIAEIKPDLIIVTSPHAVLYRDWFNVSSGEKAYGDFGQFNAPEVSFEVKYDTEFVDTLEKVMPKRFPCGTQYDREKYLDHGTMVPLYFVNQKYTDYALVRIGLSGYPLSMHYELGMYIQETVKQLNRRAVFIASGDLSHCNKGSHYGYHPEGPAYDRKIMDTMKNGELSDVLTYPGSLLDKAMECGHRSFTIMAGAFDGVKVKKEVLSYEAPWGIGYGVTVITPEGKEASSYRSYAEEKKKAYQERYDRADPLVKLAYTQVNAWVKDRKYTVLKDIPEEMKEKAGVFVSIHENGELRGCIGTIQPCYANTADEIVHNAVAACSRDPRFAPIEPSELDDLEITVDVLKKPERIHSEKELDVKRYGVICSTEDGRRGLLLPNLDGVDTVRDQIRIACSKGNIDPDSDDVILERFEAVRHV